MPKGQSKWYDVTLSGEYSVESIIEFCKQNCEKWVFQKEKGKETGYDHYQCKFVFTRPVGIETAVQTLQGFGFVNGHAERSVCLDFNYVSKSDTRTEGPWRWDDRPLPGWLREEPVWRPWQKSVIGELADQRTVMVVIDEIGNTGKSYLSNWFAVRKQATLIPLIGNYKDLMRAVQDRPKTGWYIIDVPRAARLNGAILAAIEDIKNGHAWDDRYTFTEEWFEPPKVTMFCNKQPDAKQLSYDRWKVRKIVKKGDEYVLAPL